MLFGISLSIKGSCTLFMTSEKNLCEKISQKLFLQLRLTMSILTIQGS